MNGNSRPPNPMGKLQALQAGELDIPSDVDPKLQADIEKTLEYVRVLAGDDIFDMQILVEESARELREQIREEFDGEDDEG